MAMQPHLTSINQRLSAIIEARLTDQSLARIVDNMVYKAECGDLSSAEFILNLIGDRSHHQSLPATNAVNQRPASDSPPIEKITTYLTHAGPTIPSILAYELDIPEPEIVKILDNNPQRFSVSGREYSVKKRR